MEIIKPIASLKFHHPTHVTFPSTGWWVDGSRSILVPAGGSGSTQQPKMVPRKNILY